MHKNIEPKQPQVVAPVSVSSHYNNRLIELINAMKRIQKQNYCPSSPLHIPSILKEINPLAIIQL